MGRSPCCDKAGLKRGTWTSEEDQKLVKFIEQNGHGSWRSLPEKAGLRRCGKSCRLRWNNYLRPDIKRGTFSLKEEQTIIQLHALLGNRWSTIASYLPKRTDNDIKNFWNTHLKKKLTKMGIDPVTHKPRSFAALFPGQDKAAANFSHMAQWERARLQAEARLTSQSRLAASTYPAPASLTAAGPSFKAPATASYPVENPLDDGGLDELMKLVGHGTRTADVEKSCLAVGNIADDCTFWTDQNLAGNTVESDDFTWNNLAGGDYSVSFTYGEASRGLIF